MVLLYCFVSILVPFIELGIGLKNKKKLNNDLSIFRLVMAAISSVLLINGIVFAVRFFTEGLSKYEYLFLNLFLSIITVNAFLLYFKVNEINSFFCLRLISSLALLAIAYSIITYGQTRITSDVATGSQLARCMVENRSLFPETWCYTNGEFWLLSSQLFCLLTTYIIRDQSLARMLASILFVAVVACGIRFHSKKMFEDDSWTISVPVLLLCTFGMKDMLLYQVGYVGPILWILLSNSLLYKSIYGSNDKKRYMAAYVLLMIMLTMIGPRYYAELVVPQVLTIAFKEYSDYISSNEKRPFAKSYFMIIVPALIGKVLYELLSKSRYIENTSDNRLVFAGSINAVFSNFVKTILNFFGCFGYFGDVELFSVWGFVNICSVSLCILMCFICPFLQARRIHEEKEPVQFFFAFSVIHGFILIMLSVFFGKTNTRYVFTALITLIVISARYMYDNWLTRRVGLSAILIGLFGIAVSIESFALVSESIGWRDKLAEEKRLENILIEKGIKKGYSYYWTAYEHELYSDYKLKYGGLLFYKNSPLPYYCLVDSRVFDTQDENTFLILTDEDKEKLEVSVEEIFGEPVEEFQSDSEYIYIFDHDIISDMNNGLADDVLKPRELSAEKGSPIIKRSAVTMQKDDVVFGELGSLESGRYRIHINGEDLNDCVVCISGFSDSEEISYIEIKRETNEVVVEIDLDRIIKNIRLRITNHGNNTFSIEQISVDREIS